MKLAYIIAPYRDTRGAWYIRQNIRFAEGAALALWRKGYAVICPHKNTAFFDGAADDSVWLEGDLVMLGRCDFAVQVGDRITIGMRLELDFCEENKIPVYEFAEFNQWA